MEPKELREKINPYLPHELKYLYMKKGEGIWMDNTKDHYHTLMSCCEKGYHSTSDVGITMFYEGEFTGKILLHPLSMLTKPIEHKGSKFVPKEELYKIWKKGETHSYESFEWLLEKTDLKSMPYWIVQKLIEWHFDVFNLIPQGLALPKPQEA